ncbi:MAG TPA: glycosyltransferase [Puia sp.]|nr:glycosyltransferase [Puia sp.]
MTVLIAIAGLLLLCYALLILYYHWVWRSIPENTGLATDPAIRVSVIIPARNEALKIGACLNSLLGQDYPAELMEIVVVNDFSTDDTAAVAQQYSKRVRLLNLMAFTGEQGMNAYKKKAIETGIAHSSGELIVCTDADCTSGSNWISSLVQHYQSSGACILAAPVKIETSGSALSVFQALDFISLQGITGAAVYKHLYPMSNGANLAYTREAFLAVNGFRGIDHIASGDDMLLMGKMQEQFPGKAAFVKDRRAIVSTGPAENLAVFFRQRIRWSSKAAHYKHPATMITLGLVYALNLSILILFVSCFFYPAWNWLVSLLVLKTFAEYFFVSTVARFFQQQSLMKYFIFCQPFHILYTVIAGGFGLFGRYEWKGRVVR